MGLPRASSYLAFFRVYCELALKNLYGEWFLPWFPVGAAEPARLNCFQDSKRFINATTDIQAVHDLILQNAISIDDKQSSQGNALIFQKDTIVTADVFGDVGG